jgi:tripartite-type tricarboxylate transporter receptor subunit TctC
MKHIIATLLLIPALAWAQWTPSKTVTTTIGFAPGSGNELSFRIASSIVEKQHPGVSYIINNRPGAGEIVALNWFTKLPADGSNIYIASQQGPFTANEVWFPGQANYDPMDMKFVTTIAKSPLAIVAHNSSSTNTPQQLVQRLKITKDPVNFAVGATAHQLVFEYLMDKTQGRRDLAKPVLYKGPAQALQDVAGNQVEFGIMPAAVAYPMVKAGKVKYIGLAGEQRLAQIPEVPLLKDTVPGLNVYAAWMIVLPPGSSQHQVDYYNRVFVPAINSAEAKKLFDENLMYAVASEQTPAGARRYIEGLRAQWMPYIKKIVLE